MSENYIDVARGLKGTGLTGEPDGVQAGVAVAVSLGNVENGVAFSVDCVFAVELDRGCLIVGQGAPVPDPFHAGGGLAAEPQVVADGTTFFQGDVMHAISN